MKRLLTALLLTVCTAQAQPAPDIRRVAADPLSLNTFPTQIFGETVERWRWLPETAYLSATTMVNDHYILTTGIEAQFVERDPAAGATCAVITKEVYAMPASTQRRLVQCSKNAVYVQFYLPASAVWERG